VIAIFAWPRVKVNRYLRRQPRTWYAEAMTGRERLLAAARHGYADRLPWAPKFGTWLAAHRLRGEVPALLEGCAHWHEAARRLGVDIFDKAGAVYRETHSSVRTVEEERGALRITRQVTPFGELRTVREQVDDYARTVFLTGYPVRTPEDLRAWRYLLEDTGYEAGSLAFADLPREMDSVCRLILAKNEEAYAVALESPAEVLLTGENTNSDFESPDLFGRYAFPTLRRASEIGRLVGEFGRLPLGGR
jgi:hypothetical protein